VQPHERVVQSKRHGTFEKIKRRKLLALGESEVEYRTRIVGNVLIVFRSNLEVSSEHLRDREHERLGHNQTRVLVLIRDELVHLALGRNPVFEHRALGARAVRGNTRRSKGIERKIGVERSHLVFFFAFKKKKFRFSLRFFFSGPVKARGFFWGPLLVFFWV
jgi:hypothetical protein